MITIDKLSCSFTFSICTSGKNLHVDTRGFHLLQTKIIAVVGEEKDKVGSSEPLKMPAMTLKFYYKLQ